MKTLKDVKPGNAVIVKRLHGKGAIKQKILDMGLTKGAKINVNKVAPLGDPIEISIRGYQLSVRSEEARLVEVEDIG